jgi:hypothetical protein
LILSKNIEEGNNRLSRDMLVRILASPSVAALLSSEMRAAATRLLASSEEEPSAPRDALTHPSADYIGDALNRDTV